MKRKTIIIAIIGLIAVIVVGFSHGAVAQLRGGNEPPSPPFMAANPEDVDPEYPAGPRPEIPTLTEEEEAWAIETALSDPRVQELISGKEYVIGDIGVVHTTELEKTGAGLLIYFEEPYWIEYDWPFQEETFHLGLDVLTLAILIDFEAGGVVAIRPLDNSVGR